MNAYNNLNEIIITKKRKTSRRFSVVVLASSSTQDVDQLMLNYDNWYTTRICAFLKTAFSEKKKKERKKLHILLNVFSPLTRGDAGCCWLSTSSTRRCSSSWCHPRCGTQSRQQSDTQRNYLPRTTRLNSWRWLPASSTTAPPS